MSLIKQVSFYKNFLNIKKYMDIMSKSDDFSLIIQLIDYSIRQIKNFLIIFFKKEGINIEKMNVLNNHLNLSYQFL